MAFHFTSILKSPIRRRVPSVQLKEKGPSSQLVYLLLLNPRYGSTSPLSRPVIIMFLEAQSGRSSAHQDEESQPQREACQQAEARAIGGRLQAGSSLLYQFHWKKVTLQAPRPDCPRRSGAG